MPGPAALIALAARLGIPKAAYIHIKNLKNLLQRLKKRKQLNKQKLKKVIEDRDQRENKKI